eukprot:m.362876 g.362876  ORF g.362876 m.362876 type:complete len:251 (+) comp21111_c0_seq1:140-892(+)
MAHQQGRTTRFRGITGKVMSQVIPCEPNTTLHVKARFKQEVSSPGCMFYLGLACFAKEDGTDFLPSQHRYRGGSAGIASVNLQTNSIHLREPARDFLSGGEASLLVFLDGNTNRKADYLLMRDNQETVYEGGTKANPVDVNGSTELRLGVPIPVELAERITPDSVAVSCRSGNAYHYCIACNVECGQPVEHEFEASINLDKFGWDDDCVYPSTKSVRILALPNYRGSPKAVSELTFWDVSVTRHLDVELV